jgi:hypothetical protein
MMQFVMQPGIVYQYPLWWVALLLARHRQCFSVRGRCCARDAVSARLRMPRVRHTKTVGEAGVLPTCHSAGVKDEALDVLDEF